MQLIKKLCDFDKVCATADINDGTSMDVHTKTYAGKYLRDVYREFAILSSSEIAVEDGSVYLKFATDGYRVRMRARKRRA